MEDDDEVLIVGNSSSQNPTSSFQFFPRKPTSNRVRSSLRWDTTPHWREEDDEEEYFLRMVGSSSQQPTSSYQYPSSNKPTTGNLFFRTEQEQYEELVALMRD
jgi:hypothetical protein